MLGHLITVDGTAILKTVCCKYFYSGWGFAQQTCGMARKVKRHSRWTYWVSVCVIKAFKILFWNHKPHTPK